MMEKMGWRGGGLGAGGEGRAEPVVVEQRAARAGLGSAAAMPPPAAPVARARAEVWRKTQRRFEAAPLLPAFGEDGGEEGGDT